MVLCRYIELEFNSNCKCISNVVVDCKGYNDVIGSGRRDYYVDIGVFSKVAELPAGTRHWRRQLADSKQESVIGRSGHIVKWERRKTEGKG